MISYFSRAKIFHGQKQILLVLPLLLCPISLDIRAETESGSESDPSTQDVGSQIAKLPDFPPLQQFDEVIERPLFNESRKLQAKSPGLTGGNEQTLKETWKLTGITITNERVMALFQERNGSKRLRLEVGMPLDDFWQLGQVEKDWVSVESGDKSVRLELRQPREQLLVPGNEKKAPVNGAQGSDPATSGRKANPTQGIVPQRGKVQEM